MKVHEWQKIAAKTKQPEWNCDLNDDCTAKWAGLTLRAEWMQNDNTGQIWWWAVSDDETGEEIDSSSNHSPGTLVRTGRDARDRAEMVAYRWFRVERKTDNG